VVLPKPVREALGLEPGDDFAFVIHDGEVRVVRAPAEWRGSVRVLWRTGSEPDRKGYADL
jgi:AbrB family looped-hinge helix DNA binding protein